MQDNCGAAGSAGELTAAAVDAVNQRKVPREYLEDLLGAVQELEAQIPPCEQPQGDEGDEDEDGKDKGKGKKKGHDKKDKDEGGED